MCSFAKLPVVPQLLPLYTLIQCSATGDLHLKWLLYEHNRMQVPKFVNRHIVHVWSTCQCVYGLVICKDACVIAICADAVHGPVSAAAVHDVLCGLLDGRLKMQHLAGKMLVQERVLQLSVMPAIAAALAVLMTLRITTQHFNTSVISHCKAQLCNRFFQAEQA